MINRILILLLLFLVSVVNGQSQFTLDKTYYLLGTLDDYWSGHRTNRVETSWKEVLSLPQGDIGKIRRIEEGTMLKFIRKDDSVGQIFYYLFSPNTSKTLNSFYNFKKKYGNYHDRKIKCRKLLNSSIDNQYSFLAGLVLVYGLKSDYLYTIILNNSPWRYECTIKLLKKLNSKNISCGTTYRTTPMGYFIEFEPSEELKLILDNEIERRVYLETKFYKND